QSAEIADAVAIPVGEGADGQLVEDGVLEPEGVAHGDDSGRWMGTKSSGSGAGRQGFHGGSGRAGGDRGGLSRERDAEGGSLPRLAGNFDAAAMQLHH